VGLLPAPYESAARTWNFGVSDAINTRRWLELLAFAFRQTTPGAEPVSRKQELRGCIQILLLISTGLTLDLGIGPPLGHQFNAVRRERRIYKLSMAVTENEGVIFCYCPVWIDYEYSTAIDPRE
jgi:hypothetical protein